MNEDRYMEIVALHKSWADRYTIFSQVLILLLFGTCYGLMEYADAPAEVRISSLVLLAVMVLAVMLWQAIGLGVAHIDMLLKGVDLKAARTPRK